MTDKVSAELRQLIDEAKQQKADRLLNVIITMAEGVNPNELANRGFQLNQVYSTVAVASARMTSTQIDALASSDQIERIEYDGEMHALSGEV